VAWGVRGWEREGVWAAFVAGVLEAVARWAWEGEGRGGWQDWPG